jgi:hypothetical protein
VSTVLFLGYTSHFPRLIAIFRLWSLIRPLDTDNTEKFIPENLSKSELSDSRTPKTAGDDIKGQSTSGVERKGASEDEPSLSSPNSGVKMKRHQSVGVDPNM